MWPSGTRDRGKKSGTVPEIPGQLEPMYESYAGLHTHMLLHIVLL